MNGANRPAVNTILGIAVAIYALAGPAHAHEAVAPCAKPFGNGVSADVPVLIGKWQEIAYGLKELPTPKGCPGPWVCGSVAFSTQLSSTLGGSRSVSAEIRAGYLPENPDVPFKGNIIYYEGLGDSMLNHLPLFNRLTHAGYRVIAFDYMGQGGSTGNMDNTRIEDIPKIGQLVWQKYARDLKHYPRRTVIGWSTGGLAAYYAESSNQADQVVLIAPGIAPNYIVGTQELFPLKLDAITLSTLTTQTYGKGASNPHLDPIRPTSPVAVPDFSIDLQEKAWLARHKWAIPANVRGLVLLSGSNDTYVNAKETRSALGRTAPQFQIRQYSGALHEIDNEAPPISAQADGDILNFLENKD